jgi:hypothetical protein
VEPVGEISDSKTETYDFHAAIPAEHGPPGVPVPNRAAGAQEEHVVIVRVYDRYDNMSSAKTLIPGK